MPREKSCNCVHLFISVMWEGWQTLRGTKVHSVFKVKFLFDRTGMWPGGTSPLWRQTPLFRLHKDKLLGRNWNPLRQQHNSLDFSDSKEFGYSIILYDVVVKITVTILRRNQLKALCFFGKVLSSLDLIFLELSVGWLPCNWNFCLFWKYKISFFQCTDWMKLPSTIKEIWHNKQKIIPAHNFLLWRWNKGIKWECLWTLLP